MSNNQNPEEMKRLQQEAVRRVQEMQSRSRAPASSPHPQEPAMHSQRRPEFFMGGPSAARPLERQGAHPENEREPEQRPVPSRHPEHLPAPPPGGGITDIFEALMSDSERILILMLILLLVNEGADTGLVLALMYLII